MNQFIGAQDAYIYALKTTYPLTGTSLRSRMKAHFAARARARPAVDKSRDRSARPDYPTHRDKSHGVSEPVANGSIDLAKEMTRLSMLVAEEPETKVDFEATLSNLAPHTPSIHAHDGKTPTRMHRTSRYAQNVPSEFEKALDSVDNINKSLSTASESYKEAQDMLKSAHINSSDRLDAQNIILQLLDRHSDLVDCLKSIVTRGRRRERKFELATGV